MGWSIGYDSHWNRDIGYGVPAYCDHPGCNEEIDRGLAHVCCGQEPCGGDDGCGLYFCGQHRYGSGKCERCAAYDADVDSQAPPPFDAKADHPRWVFHKLNDPSWSAWRNEHPKRVAAMRVAIGDYRPPAEDADIAGPKCAG